MQRTYTAGGREYPLTIDPGLVAVRFRKPAPRSMRDAVARKFGLGSFRDRIEVPRQKYTIFVLPPAATEEEAEARLKSLLRRLNRAPQVERAAEVYTVGSTLVLATDRLIVATRDEKTSDLQSRLRERGFRVFEEGLGRLLVRVGAAEDPFAESRGIERMRGVWYAQPDFVSITRINPEPGDLPFEKDGSLESLPAPRWALDRVEAAAAQAAVPDRARIRIAVLDVGVEVAHADLEAAADRGFDATDGDDLQVPRRHDWHGTACAGLAAAVPAAEGGMRGVASGCRLMPVRVAVTNPEEPRTWSTEDSTIARGIRWAWENGADVLSNSWERPRSFDLERAIDEALASGRGGKGCVIVAAAGNDGGAVLFPASYPGVVAVAASNLDDAPKTLESGDQWGSAVGPQVAIAAPGVRVFTTDNEGNRGASADDYLPNFKGTSAAAAIVAGAAALVLAVRPELKPDQVRQILCDSAEKKGPHPYVNGRNDFMGHGRLNARKAVELALQLPAPAPAPAGPAPLIVVPVGGADPPSDVVVPLV